MHNRLEKKTSSSLTKLMEWNIYLGFNVYKCIDCWVDDCYFLPSFKLHMIPYHEWIGKFPCLLEAVNFMCFIWMARDKRSSIITLANSISWFFTEYHFNAIVHTSWLFTFAYFNLIFYCSCVSHGFRFLFFMQPISNSSVTNINSFQPIYFPFVLLYLFLFSRPIGSNFFILTLVYLLLSINMFSFLNLPIPSIFAPNFRLIWQAANSVFRKSSLWIAFLNDFFDPFHYFNC